MAAKVHKMRADLLPGGEILVTAWVADGKAIRRHVSKMKKHDPEEIMALAETPEKFPTFLPKPTPEGGSGT